MLTAGVITTTTAEERRSRRNAPISQSLNQAELRKEIASQKLVKSSNDVKQKDLGSIYKLSETQSHKKLSA